MSFIKHGLKYIEYKKLPKALALLKYSEFVDRKINESILNEQVIFPSWPMIQALFKAWWNRKKPKVTPTPKVTNAPAYLTGKHLLYIPHQQGPVGAAAIVNSAMGKGPLGDKIRKNILGNVPTNSKYYNIIKDTKKTDKAAAIAFLSYYSDNWNKLEKEAMALINNPKYDKIKKAIDAIKNPGFPKDFLTTVAFKESSFNSNPTTNKTYKGLFQIGPSAWAELKRVFPTTYKGLAIPLDPKINAQAGHDYLKLTYDRFKKKVGI